MSMRPVPARWFELLADRDELTLAVEALARTGSIELETQSDIRARFSLPDLQERMEEFNRLARRYHPYWPDSSIQPSGVPGSPANILDNALKNLRSWEMAAAPLIRNLESVTSETTELILLEEMLQSFSDETLDFSLMAKAGPLLIARLFVMPMGSHIEQMPGTLINVRSSSDAHEFLLAVGTPEDIATLTTELTAQKGSYLSIPTWLKGKREKALEQIREHIVKNNKELASLNKIISSLSEPNHLVESLNEISRLEWFLTHVSDLPISENFAWVTGWTSDASGEQLNAALQKENLNAIIHFPSAPRKSHPPMVMNNPWWAQPFELFARMLGTPDRNEADPSRLLAILAPLLFGYMFGDVGHGLVLVIVGIILQHRWPVLKILIANGIAAMIFGVLFGSIFGREDLIPALWIHPIEQPLLVLMIPLAGGVVVLMLGLLLNAIESYWRGEISRWFRIEAAILLMYIGLIMSIVTTDALYLAVGGLVWYFTGNLLESSGKIISTLLTALGILVESVLQLLINTVSFVRVGAFALAHAGLSLAFTILADASQSIVISLLILLVGNAIVILLEGLVVTIQTTRLILFEFFIRFLRGSGRMFRPLPAPASEIGIRRKM